MSLEHQNPSKTSEIMGYFDRVDDRVTVSLHILYTANQETEGSQDRLTALISLFWAPTYSTNYRHFEFPFDMIGKWTIALLTVQSWQVLKS